MSQTRQPPAARCGCTGDPAARSPPHPRHAAVEARDPVEGRHERLGHSTPAFTMAVHQHVLPGMQRDAANTFAASSHPSIQTTQPRDVGSGKVAPRDAKRPWSDMVSDQGLWWRGLDQNLRPSGYERRRWSALGRVGGGRGPIRPLRRGCSSALVRSRKNPSCSRSVRGATATELPPQCRGPTWMYALATRPIRQPASRPRGQD